MLELDDLTGLGLPADEPLEAIDLVQRRDVQLARQAQRVTLDPAGRSTAVLALRAAQ